MAHRIKILVQTQAQDQENVLGPTHAYMYVSVGQGYHGIETDGEQCRHSGEFMFESLDEGGVI